MSKKKTKKMRRKHWQPKKSLPDDAVAATRHNELPPIVSGSRKRARNVVEFVYPKDSSNERKKYVFGKQRKSPQTCETTPARKLDPNTLQRTTTETIDDILFSSAKKQRKNCVEEAKRQEDSCNESRSSGSSESLSLQEEPEGGQLSGLSVEDAVRDKVGCRPRANSTDGELNLPRRGLCDERMVLERYRWKTSLPPHRPKGFHNLGNTCFLNATLQCLAYLPTFSQTLMSLPAMNRGTNGQKPTKGQRMTFMLSALFRQVHGMNGGTGGEHALSPRGIVRAVPTLGSGGRRSGYTFRPGQQEDAHEFLVHLLDAMQDGELRAAGINQHVSGWRDRLPVPRLDETTFINRIFGGYLRSQIRCTNCGYRSNTYDPCLDLSLEVSNKSSCSVASAFSEFTRKETLDSRNRWKCSGCKKHVCAMKQLTVFRPPLSLCIQLKRFTYGGGFGNFSSGWGFGHYGGKGIGMMGRGGSKISKPIEFPASLKLPLSDGRNCEYNLTGVVVHIGGSASSGHYTAFVKKPGASSKHQWYHMDDSFVEPVSETTVLRQKDAYLLFYCRKEVKIEYPSPPRRFASAEAARESGAARARARSNSLERQEAYAESTSTSGASGGDDHVAVNSNRLSRPSSQSGTEVVEARTSPGSISLEKKPPHSLKTSNDSSTSSSSGESENESSSSDSSSSSSSKSSGLSENDHDERNVSVPGERNDDNAKIQTREKVNSSRATSSNGSSESGVDGSRREAQVNQKEESKTRVVVDHGGARGKLEVFLGPRRGSKAWKPKATTSIVRGKNLELLGSVKVDKWGEEEDEDVQMPSNLSSHAQSEQRASALKQLDVRERTRKRKMHLDRWDAMLDEGKKKRVKEKQEVAPMAVFEPKKNPFDRIQRGIQRMNRGRAKGFHRNKAFPSRGHRNKRRR